MSHVGAAMAEHMMQTPTGRFSKQRPEPERFPQFLDKMGKMMSEDYDWSADIAKLPMPVLLVFADNDSVSQKHVAEFFALLGGGVKEPGWVNTQLSKSRLAVVPGYSHYNFITSPDVPQIVGKFLADPLSNPPTGATPASQAAPDLSSLDWLATRVLFNAPWRSRGDPAAMTHSKRVMSSDIQASRTNHHGLQARDPGRARSDSSDLCRAP